MKLSDRFRRLTLWNKLGVAGSIASLVALGLALLWSPGSDMIELSPSGVDKLAEALASRIRQQQELKPTATGREQPAVERVGGLELAGPELVLVLIDTSGSMRRSPVREALLSILGNLRRHDLVAIVTFSERSVEVLPFADHTMAVIRGVVERLEFNGWLADFRDSLSTVVAALPEVPGYQRRLVLLTDAVGIIDESGPQNAFSPPWGLVLQKAVEVDVFLLVEGAAGREHLPSVPVGINVQVWPPTGESGD